MADLPKFVRVISSGAGVDLPDPKVDRTDMDRGPAKQVIGDDHVMLNIEVTFMFESKKDSLAFDDWYFDDIKRAGWFNMRNPYTGLITSVRFPEGKIGKLVSQDNRYGISTRQCVVEYQR
jgi:hypothetical protein